MRLEKVSLRDLLILVHLKYEGKAGARGIRQSRGSLTRERRVGSTAVIGSTSGKPCFRVLDTYKRTMWMVLSAAPSYRGQSPFPFSPLTCTCGLRSLCNRRIFRETEAETRKQQAARVLNRLVTRVYRGHLYGRKPARKLRAQREAAGWGPSEWEVGSANLPRC